MSFTIDGQRKDVIAKDDSDYVANTAERHVQDTDNKLDDGGANEVTAANAKDAVDKKHTQGTDLGLDTGGSNPITAATAKTHVDTVAGNPHAVTKAEVSLANVTDDAQLKRAAGDIGTFTEKTAPVGDDELLLEDSADSDNKKSVKLKNMHEKTLTFFPEYPGSVQYAYGGGNSDVDISSDHDWTNRFNYVSGTTEVATPTQKRALVFQFTLPEWFEDVDTSEAVSFYYKDDGGGVGNTGSRIVVKDASGNTFTSGLKTAAGWTKYSILKSDLTTASLSFSAGDKITIAVVLECDQSETADVREVVVKFA